MSDRASSRSGSIHLHSSWTGLVTACLGAFLAALLAVFLVADGGSSVASAVVAVTAVALLAVVLFDVPIAAEFTADGVTRRMIGRRQVLEWDRVDRLERMRVGVLRTRNGRGGGLIARIGSRRYVLVDRMEGPLEFDELRRILGADRADAYGLVTDLRPPDDRNPTWLYRRSTWRPDGL